MPIPLNTTLVDAIRRERFETINDMLAEWEHRVETKKQRQGQARSKATVHRWLADGFPSNQDDIFGFAALLDVDPIGILNIDREYVSRQFGIERRLFQLPDPHKSPLSPLWPIYFPGPSWPNDELTQTYYGRSWCAREFVHDASVCSNVYAAVHLAPTADIPPHAPRVFHFAYRRTNASDRMWRPYGTVIGLNGEVCLISENGDYERITDERSPETVVVETHFGPGSAEFSVASVHTFEITKQDAPSAEKIAVRFRS